MKRDVTTYLEDIVLSIELINRYTSDLSSVEDYKKDEETIDSVERRVSIIGEALFKADKLEPDLPISDKQKIINLRHILVHDYSFINHSTIWEIIKEHLPLLKKEVQSLLD